MLSKAREKLKWLDPFTYVDLYVMPVVNPEDNPHIELIVDVVFAFIFAFVLYNYVLAFLLGTQSPLVIVYSNSMEPVLHRGDVVVLTGAKVISVRQADVGFPLTGKAVRDFAQPVLGTYIGTQRVSGITISGKMYGFDSTGPIVVYTSTLNHLDIIHRAVLKLAAPDGNFLLTYGDNGRTNNSFDELCPANPKCSPDSHGCDCITEYPVKVSQFKGKYLFHIPYIGYIKLLLFDDLPRMLLGNN